MWGSQRTPWGSCGIQIQVVQIGGKCLYPLSISQAYILPSVFWDGISDSPGWHLTPDPLPTLHMRWNYSWTPPHRDFNFPFIICFPLPTIVHSKRSSWETWNCFSGVGLYRIMTGSHWTNLALLWRYLDHVTFNTQKKLAMKWDLVDGHCIFFFSCLHVYFVYPKPLKFLCLSCCAFVSNDKLLRKEDWMCVCHFSSL